MIKLIVIGHMIVNFILCFRLELKMKTISDKELYNPLLNELNQMNELFSIESDNFRSEMSNL
jgi:hypothetical protein